jgi:DNA-binding NarL/FixJ family response regulator
MKILIADDHALFRAGLRHVLAQLEDDVEVVEAADGRQTLECVDANPDTGLVLLDLDMPGPDGFAALASLSRRHPALPIIVLSGSEERSDMRRALDLGAMGFIPKSATAPVMLGALRLVLAGGVYVPPELIQSGSGVGIESSEELVSKLTPRQLDVLHCVIEGKPNKIIADDLGVSEATVKAHMSAVFKALEVDNRTQAARAAERLGLRPPGTRTT